MDAVRSTQTSEIAPIHKSKKAQIQYRSKVNSTGFILQSVLEETQAYS